ncbi:MAG: NADH-quinone oxidoreductase subunit L [Coriobacteriia bacterium]|nr:NADH-quinone oxidoreductase subunit L [Coriobacteriia bacterium]
MEELLLLVFLIPIIGSFLLPLVAKFSETLRNVLSLVFVLSAFACSAALVPSAMAGNPASVHFWLPMGFSFGFSADGLAVFMALIASFVGAIIVIYSFTYIEHSDHKNVYYLMVTLFIGAMMGLVYSTNLIFIYIFWEISAISCWQLIGYYREPEHVLRADKAFLMTVFGALVMLAGFVLVYQQTGTFDITEMQGAELGNAAVLLILVGLLSKSATLPLHTWLPDAGVAPSPVTSLLHAAVLVKIGVYAFARFFIFSFNVDPMWHKVVPIVAACSAIVSAGAAMVEYDIKRIIAYSTISQIAFIFLGLSINNKIGVAGGLLYIMMHSLAKGGLFLCAGVVEHSTHTKDIRQLGGLIRTMPVTAVAFLICAFSIMGLPPLGGFFSKYMVVSGAVFADSPWIATVFIFGTLMTIIYLMRVFNAVFLGTSPAKIVDIHEGSRSMVASALSLAVFSLIGGLLIYYPSEFVQTVIAQIGGLLS